MKILLTTDFTEFNGLEVINGWRRSRLL